MPIRSPFHERTFPLCGSLLYKDWGGYHTVRSYDTCHEREYFAFRHAAGLMDVTPLFKYDVRGKDATAFLTRTMVRNIAKLKPGRVTYCCWCDDHGKVIDDGTVTCVTPEHYFVTAADPTLRWFQECAVGYQVEIEDLTGKLGALALQGPNSRSILAACSSADMDKLRFFRAVDTKIDNVDVRITRTGYTGDLGYEVWVPNADAIKVWDALMASGKPYGIEPAGLDALDLARVEAAFIMQGVDYFSARHCIIPSRMSTPYELDLGWTVNLERDPFIGQKALIKEKEEGSERAFVGLDIAWEPLVRLYDALELPPSLSSAAWRTPTPVFERANEDSEEPLGPQVGRASSGAWSPTLKQNLALATVDARHAAIGTELEIEVTVEYVRHRVPATVVKKPFFDPDRKRS